MKAENSRGGLREWLLDRQPDRWIFVGLLLLLVWLPLARGGNRLWAVSLYELQVFSLAAAWSLLYVRGRLKWPESLSRARPVLLLWLAWLALVAWQLVPLPVGIVEWLSPSSAQAWAGAAEFLGETWRFVPLSLAPGETAAHWLESAAHFTLFCLVLATVRDLRRLRVLAILLVFSGLFQALYGTLFLLSGASQGLFLDAASPLDAATGTFVNRNHLAGYLEICSAVGVGLVLASLGQVSLPHWRARLRYLVDLLLSPTIRLRVFLALMVIALVLTRSRMGNVAFFGSLAVAGLVYVLLRERRLFLKSLLVFVTLFLVDLWIVGSWFGVDEVVQRLEETNLAQETRVTVWPGLVETLRHYWLTGAGLGTFAIAFLPFRAQEVTGFHDHAHNDYMQFLIEMGIPGGLLLAAIVTWVAVHAVTVLLNRRNRLACGIAFAALMALLAIAIHSITDFNLQIPANAATLVTVMAMTVACAPRSRRRRRSRAAQEPAGMNYTHPSAATAADGIQR